MHPTREWGWLQPSRTLELAGRCASLVLAIACAANMLLVKVSSTPGNFELFISIASGLAAAGMIGRVVWPVSVISEEATWLACGVWVANLVEICLSPEVRTYSKLRQSGFYLAFAIAAACVYLIERLTRMAQSKT